MPLLRATPPRPPHSQTPDRPLSSYTLGQVGAGSGYVIWGLRALVQGPPTIDGVARALSAMLGADGMAATTRLAQFADQLDGKGRRHVALAPSAQWELTHDELSLVSLFAASQAGARAAVGAHLTWLLGAGPALPQSLALSMTLSRLVEDIADIFSCHGVTIKPLTAAPRDPARAPGPFRPLTLTASSPPR